jgi:hypothetical protein
MRKVNWSYAFGWLAVIVFSFVAAALIGFALVNIL